jgi:hypothetical protein
MTARASWCRAHNLQVKVSDWSRTMSMEDTLTGVSQRAGRRLDKTQTNLPKKGESPKRSQENKY